MPGVFAQIGMEYGHRYGGTSFELFAKISEKNHAHSTLNPLAAYSEAVHPRADHGRRHDLVPQHPAHVLGQLRRRGRRRRGAAAPDVEDALARAAASGRSRSRRPILTTDPWEEACQVLPDVNTLTRNAAAGLREGRHRARPTSTSSSCTTASPPPSWSTTTISCYAKRAARLTFSTPERRGGTAPRRSTCRVGSQSKGHPIAATGIANVWEVATHLRGEAGNRQIEGGQGRPDPRHRPRIGLRRPHPPARGVASLGPCAIETSARPGCTCRGCAWA